VPVDFERDRIGATLDEAGFTFQEAACSHGSVSRCT